MLDQLDLDLLRELQENCRRPITQIAQELGRPTGTIRDRIKRLEETGVIEGYSAVVDPSSVGLSLPVIIHITVEEQIINPEAFLDRIGMIPEVASAVLVTGDYEAIVFLHVQGVEHLRRILYEDVLAIPAVTRTNTSIVLMKQEWNIPRARCQ